MRVSSARAARWRSAPSRCLQPSPPRRSLRSRRFIIRSRARATRADNYFGTTVADPYRWLEDTDSPETKQWVEAENALTFQYLEAIPERASIKEQLTRVWNYPKYNVPTKRGKDYFFTENSGLQNQAVLYVQHGLKGAAEGGARSEHALLRRHRRARAGGTRRENGKLPRVRRLDGRLATGKRFACATSKRASDLADTLKWVKFSNIAWTKDHKGFFYSRFERAEERKHDAREEHGAEALLSSRR